MIGDLNIFETVLYSAVVAQKAPQAKDQGSQQLCSNIDIYPEKKSERKKYRFIYNNNIGTFTIILIMLDQSTVPSKKYEKSIRIY